MDFFGSYTYNYFVLQCNREWNFLKLLIPKLFSTYDNKESEVKCIFKLNKGVLDPRENYGEYQNFVNIDYPENCRTTFLCKHFCIS